MRAEPKDATKPREEPPVMGTAASQPEPLEREEDSTHGRVPDPQQLRQSTLAAMPKHEIAPVR